MQSFFCRVGIWALFGLTVAVPAAAADDGPVYRFSPVNLYGINLTAAYWNPIINYVSDKSGVKLQLKIGRTSADTTSFVLAREVEFVFSNHLFSPEREKLGWKVFGRRLTPSVFGQIVVLADSPITAVEQLNGKQVAFPGPEALVSYKFPYAHLLSKKIDVQVVFGGNTDAALAQLFSGKVAAAGGNSQVIEGYAKREEKKYRVLWQSPPLNDLALMHAANVPAKDVRAVTEAFLGMQRDPKGRDILKQASSAVGLGVDAYFIESDGREYAAYRDFYRSAPAALR